MQREIEKMEKLLKSLDVNSVNGLYRMYQYNDGNPLPKLVITKITKDVELQVRNMYGELKKLNNEFTLKLIINQ